MDSLELKVSTEQVVSLARQLPREIKWQLVQEWLTELKTEPGELLIEGYDEAFELEEAKLRPDQLAGLQELWADEPSAEELCQLLTP